MKVSWDDLSLFAIVARRGQLAAAATEANVSQATLSRRMTALEARLGRRLFCHGKAGYTPTAEGRTLLDMAKRMEAEAARIGQWTGHESGPVRVRLSAGSWNSFDLAEHLAEFWSADAPWVPEFIHCNAVMDIARREIDIGIRNRRPEQPWLAARRTGRQSYAVYAKSAQVTAWIGPSYDAATLPSWQWVERTHGDAIVTTVNDPRVALSLARAGVGRMILPCFVGERSGLTRIGHQIPELAHDEWLVCHHESRFDPGIREALDAIAGYLSTRPGTRKSNIAQSSS